MFRAFNCFQFVILFACFPFIIQWVSQQNFSGHVALYYALCVAYVVQFFLTIAAVYSGTEKL